MFFACVLLALSSSVRRIERRRRLGRLGAVGLNDGLDLALVEAVGGGRGMARDVDRRVHVSKYREDVPLDPWEAAVAENEALNAPNETAARLASRDPFVVGAEALRKRGGLRRKPIDAMEADGRDPATFGFVPIGTIVGSHGVRGMFRVDTTSDFGQIRFCEPGIRHLKLPMRRSPRPVSLLSGKRLKNLGSKTRYVVQIDGVETREAAASLAGATLYIADEERAPEGGDGGGDDDDDYYLVDDLVGATAYDAETNDPIGLVADVIAPPTIDGAALGHSHLEIELTDRPRFRCLVPLAAPIVTDVDLDLGAIFLRPPDGLLDLASLYKRPPGSSPLLTTKTIIDLSSYEYTPPPPFIRGFLPPPCEEEELAYDPRLT